MAVNPAVFQLSQSQPETKATLNTNFSSNFSSDNSSSESAPVPDLIPRTTATTVVGTKVIPPPPVQSRKVDNSLSHRVVSPAKESCYNLAILTPNIAPSGTKSRVETQVRVALDLALTSGSSGTPSNYDRVGSWKWLRLPKGTATRKRSRKDGKIDASPTDTLFLETEVTCASNPSKQVLSCTTCQGREAKRVARKIAARVRPSRSDSESNDGEGDSSSKIIQFNCPDTLDFSGGSAVLPLRITCYCRHHREKVGFNVHFAMRDASGRVVGEGVSPPIMITDDHKSTDKNAPKQSQIPLYLGGTDWEPRALSIPLSSEPVPADAGAPSRRRQSGSKESVGSTKRRMKPYDSARSTSSRPYRGEQSDASTQPIINTTSPAVSRSHPDTAMFTPHNRTAPSIFSGTPPSSASQRRSSETALPSPPNSNTSPVSPETNYSESHDMTMHDVLMQQTPFFPLSPPDTAPSSPPMTNVLQAVSSSARIDLPTFSYSLLRPQPEPPILTLPAPKIHRLIPSSGPTFGGIEVTVLGSNFHSSILYNCVFGDVVASSTSRWSENTLVSILPPRAYAGVVPVTLECMKLDVDPGSEPALFTYVDETDRTLMELALQVVGLKMTGKIEDAKDIAMRIVGTSAQESQSANMDANQMMNLASSALPDSRRLLLGRTDDVEFEKIIMDSLSSLDMRDSSGEPSQLTSVISHPTKTGQTLLHLAAYLNFPSLVEFLVQRDISLDVQDINGYTALHFAVLSGSQCCTRQIINAGADITICTKMGYTAVELASEDFFGHVHSSEESQSEESDEESHFGDVEEDSGEGSRPQSRVPFRRRIRHPRSRRPSKPVSIASDGSDVEQAFDPRAAAEDDDNATVVSPECLPMPDQPHKDATMDEKQAATFAEFLQRAWAQFNPPHLMPQMPHMPQLPGMPAWVFPVFVPMQAWPPFRTEKRGKEHNGKEETADTDGPRSPGNEWRASWEKWMAQMSAAMARQNQLAGTTADVSVDVEKPLQSEAKLDGKLDAAEVATVLPVTPAPVASRSILRRFGYGQQPVQVTEKEVKAYSYRPKSKSLVKTVKKEDRMLIIFWIPILILALGWALYSSKPVVSMLKQYLPLEEVVGRFTVVP
ncbi:hypothetical protein DFH11DRAFT_1501793 [Phellopilus nigrolimitatus]|nr:hypothetical protein DFH11DRAFT_1501793 [Phellopilus nigrolimitatus]